MQGDLTGLPSLTRRSPPFNSCRCLIDHPNKDLCKFFVNSQIKFFLHLPPELIFEFAVERNQHGFKCAIQVFHMSHKVCHLSIQALTAVVHPMLDGQVGVIYNAVWDRGPDLNSITQIRRFRRGVNEVCYWKTQLIHIKIIE